MAKHPHYSRLTEVTDGIRVSVQSTYVKNEAARNNQYYVFAYKIEIRNESDRAVKLLSRKWVVINAVGEKTIVEGEGVVGQQPLIEPGATYEYVSGTHFPTPSGKMEGFYTMEQKGDNRLLMVKIPAFTMVAPFASN